MKRHGLKRLRGAGCNSSSIKHKVSDWKKRYDLSGGYLLKTKPRVKGI